MSGELPVKLTNDLFFKLLGQKNLFALKHLISSITHIDANDICSLQIRNPVILKDTMSDKEFILDINVEMNDNTYIDLEMQVVDYGDWAERSVQYLSRTYDMLNRGEDYIRSKTAIHIGILDYEHFPGDSKLLDSYRLMSVKNQRIYTDKFQLYVLCLPKCNEPDAEDMDYHTDVWARFFKAKTWEDIKMLTELDQGIASAASTVYELEGDEMARQKALAREDFLRRQRTQQRKLSMLESRLSDAESRLSDTESRLNDTESRLNDTEFQRDEAIAQRDAAEARAADAELEIERLRKLLKN